MRAIYSNNVLRLIFRVYFLLYTGLFEIHEEIEYFYHLVLYDMQFVVNYLSKVY